MSTYYGSTFNSFPTQNELRHYGVKGMKWKQSKVKRDSAGNPVDKNGEPLLDIGGGKRITLSQMYERAKRAENGRKKLLNSTISTENLINDPYMSGEKRDGKFVQLSKKEADRTHWSNVRALNRGLKKKKKRVSKVTGTGPISTTKKKKKSSK